MSRARGRPRNPEADRAILQAALEVFIEGGVEGASIEQIAKRAGVGKLTVYRRWDSKEAVLAAAIETARDGIPEAPADLADLPVTTLVRKLLPGLAEAIAEPRLRAMIARIFGASVSHPELMATYWENYVVPRRRNTRALLERAQAEGTIAADADLDALIDMMVGAVLFRLVQPEPLDVAGATAYLESVYRQAGLL
ncbi:DNA-binding transcriptional regulator, AcrR family [Saccharopolyspora antimicrobica]|uniref:DNA-binding transcriptional regulator, AcrR family n=1 Tax=Saccharopolyspora antimicrobica TaxID=455193 RepID=A0A1I5HI09_9PSEU|nr:TetR/AcrR family transcriptional regulator [Saccharopolyspora antimicrobica]RKT85303.1 TetR family transcriptional regulator [Saccharopolyspora antimicrobica]SFO47491.1 DNA-binding transcriptional regulator, AcrR family [Saccharopolyspora antimicrobica]